ncbi:hypothetical protein OE88DRAFT_412264 [Heliocybe sulcata]|uniref:Uncharacterized protein n=1 Tax=Heliocybe sulcata TaxID=5364 RepID=A0A5C3MZW9_9AGAM|nr:hypothetical protein OE88DRAFT_412264 [Heliocybe sulcata]
MSSSPLKRTAETRDTPYRTSRFSKMDEETTICQVSLFLYALATIFRCGSPPIEITVGRHLKQTDSVVRILVSIPRTRGNDRSSSFTTRL